MAATGAARRGKKRSGGEKFNDDAAKSFVDAILSAPSTSTSSTISVRALKSSSPGLLDRIDQLVFAKIFTSLLNEGLNEAASTLASELSSADETIFTERQKWQGLKVLISLWSSRRTLPSAGVEALFSRSTLATYFARLYALSGCSVDAAELAPMEARSVLAALVRSVHPLLWDGECITGLWKAAKPTLQERNSQPGAGVNIHVGFALLIAWLDIGAPDMNQLPLKIFEDLFSWGHIAPDEVYDAGVVQREDTPRTTILGTLARAGARQSAQLAPAITNGFYTVHAADGPLRVLATLAKQELKRSPDMLGPAGEAYVQLAPEVTGLFLRAEGARLGTRQRLRGHACPSSSAVDLHLSLDPFLPSAGRGSAHQAVAERDAEASAQLLDWLTTLGHGPLLVRAYLGLLRQRRARAPGWTLDRIQRALSTLASPASSSTNVFAPPGSGLMTAATGDGTPALSRKRLVQLVASELMGAAEIRAEREDVRMRAVRRRALQIILEHPDGRFPWRRFLADCDRTHDSRDQLLEMVAELWRLGWLDAPTETRSQVPLGLLDGMTRFVAAVSGEIARELLKSVVTRFVADRTPSYDPSCSPYFTVAEPALAHADLTALARAHVVIGGGLALRFAAEAFARMARERWVPTAAEDVALLWQVMRRLADAAGRPEAELVRWWAAKAARATALGFDTWITRDLGTSQRIGTLVSALRTKTRRREAEDVG